MGSTCSYDAYERKFIQSEIQDKDWAEVVTTNNLTGIKMLHHNSEIIDYTIDKFNTTALLFAVREQHLPAAHYLLNSGANVNTMGGRMVNTPLHEAVINKDWNTARLLFQHGADDLIENIEGKTPLDIAKSQKNDRRDYLKEFLDSMKTGTDQMTSKYCERNQMIPSPTIMA